MQQCFVIDNIICSYPIICIFKISTGTVSDRVDLERALPNIASDLTQEQFERLGITLKFRPAQINRFSSTNFMTGRLTTRGTLDMLYEWRSRTAVPDQKPELRAALLSLGLRTLADEHLPLG